MLDHRGPSRTTPHQSECRGGWSLALAATLLCCSVHLASAQATITLDETVTYQTMRGWEVTPFIAGDCDPLYEAIRDTVVALAVDDVGIDRLRLEIRAGVENSVDHYANYVAAGCPDPPDPAYQAWRENRYATINDNADPDIIDGAGFNFTELDRTIEEVVLPMRSRVEANGESLFVNLCYVAFTSQITTGSYHHDDPDEYAEFVLATYLHMDSVYGFVPHTWEILLEPDNVAQWNGALIGQAIVAAAAKLSASGYTPRFVAPSNTSMAGAVTYFDGMLTISGAVDDLEEYSYHRYTGVSEANLAAIVARAHTHGLSTSMLEWWFGNGTYEVLHQDLTLGENSSWQGRTLRALFDVQGTMPSNLTVTYNRDTQYNRQFFKYVRQEATRIDAASNQSIFEPVAWINPDASWIVVVKASAGGDIDIEGLPAGTYGATYTLGAANQDPSAFDVALPDIQINAGAPLQLTMPDRGLLTIFSQPAASDVADDPVPADPDAPFTAEPAAGAWQTYAVPNPASGECSIVYRTEQPGGVGIRVYDAAGRVVHEHAATGREVGTHRYDWAVDLAEGVYVYELSWNGSVVGGNKLVVLR